MEAVRGRRGGPAAAWFWRRHAGLVIAAVRRLETAAADGHTPRQRIRRVADAVGRLAAHGVAVRVVRRRTVEEPDGYPRVEAVLRKETGEDAAVHVEWMGRDAGVAWDEYGDSADWQDPCEERPLSAWLGREGAREEQPPEEVETIGRLGALGPAVSALSEPRTAGEMLAETPPARVLGRGAKGIEEGLAAIRRWKEWCPEAPDPGTLDALVRQLGTHSQSTLRLDRDPQGRVVLVELRCHTNRGLRLKRGAYPGSMTTAVEYFPPWIAIERGTDDEWELETDEWGDACLAYLDENGSAFRDRLVVRETLAEVAEARGVRCAPDNGAEEARS